MVTPAPDFAGFRPAALRFLRGLARNNRRDWFEPRRAIYDEELRLPMRALLSEVDVRLATIAPELVADPRRSLFRIHRDVRFSRDKSPYKTNVGFWINHRSLGGPAGTVVHGGAGLYFHIAPPPDGCFVAAGIWMPPPPVLARIREGLTDDLPGFVRALRTLRPHFGALSDEAKLTRLPRGFGPSHPAAQWLLYRSFTVSRPVPPALLGRADLPDRLARLYRPAIPLVRWINTVLGCPPAARR